MMVAIKMEKNYKRHPESSHANCPSSGLTQQIEPLSSLSSTEIESGSKTHYIDEDNDEDNGSIKKKSKKYSTNKVQI